MHCNRFIFDSTRETEKLAHFFSETRCIVGILVGQYKFRDSGRGRGPDWRGA